VDVKVWNTLAGSIACIDNDAVPTLGNIQLIRDFCCGVQKMSHQRKIQFRSVVERFEIVLARYQQNVNWSLGIGILYRNDLIVVINDFTRKIAGYDATENATLIRIFHNLVLRQLSTKRRNRVKHLICNKALLSSLFNS